MSPPRRAPNAISNWRLYLVSTSLIGARDSLPSASIFSKILDSLTLERIYRPTITSTALSRKGTRQFAEMAQNPFLMKYMRELCSLTCLVIALYDAPGMPACPHPEHSNIVDALDACDADRACALTVAHLTHVENASRLELPAGDDIDFEAVFA